MVCVYDQTSLHRNFQLLLNLFLMASVGWLTDRTMHSVNIFEEVSISAADGEITAITNSPYLISWLWNVLNTAPSGDLAFT